MSCKNNDINIDINIDLKELTAESLNYIYNYTSDIKNTNSNSFKYTNNINNPFSDIFIKNYSNIQTDLNVENVEGLSYITRSNEDDDNYINCAIQTNNRWFTLSDDYKKCQVVNNFEYDESRIKINTINDKSIITPILVSKNKSKPAFCTYSSNVNKSYCENRWYDWIITPNYYLGNTYYKDNSHYTELDVYKCYKPCEDDYMPYTKENGEIKCIPKKYFANGIFNKKYMFNSIMIINLIGNIACDDNDKSSYKTNLLYILHRLIYEYKTTNDIDNELYKIDDTLDNLIKLEPIIKDTSLYNFIKTDSETLDITDKERIFKKILQNDYNNIYDEIKKTIENHILKNFSESDNKDYSNLNNEFTYKHYKFNENEPEMYSYVGMETNGLLIDPILIHTWMLTQLFKPIDENNPIFTTYTNSNYGGDGDASKNIILNNIQYETIYKKLLPIFGKHKAIRLKNIFLKAIDNCYNNKTNFSTNFIAITKRALENAELINIITSNNLYLFQYNLNFMKLPTISSETINVVVDTTIRNTKYNQLLTYNDINIKYYSDIDIKIFIDKIKQTNNNNFRLKYIENDKYCHYFYSMEELEQPTCPKDHEYDIKLKECRYKQIKKEEEVKPTNEEDDFIIPNFTNIFAIFVKILIVIIILYVLYILYDIFGELIKSSINFIIVFMINIYNNAYIALTTGSNDYEKEQKRLNFLINNTKSDLERIKNKSNTINEYMMNNQHKK